MDKILELLGLSQLMQPKAHDNIDSLIQNNQKQAYNDSMAGMLYNMPEQKIGPIPESGLSQQDLLEMIMPFGAMGRVAKTAPKIGRGIIEASKGMPRRGTQDQTLGELGRRKHSTYPEIDADNFFKKTIRNLFESMEGKEF